MSHEQAGAGAFTILLLSSLVAIPVGALPRDVVVRFLAPQGVVDGYRFYVHDEVARTTRALDVGYLAPDADGIGRAVLRLEESRSHRVTMSAYNASGESPRSNPLLLPAACDPGRCGAGNLSVTRLVPNRLSPGKSVVTIEGTGFDRKPKVSFENGAGRRPKVRYARVLDDATLEIGVRVRQRGLDGPDTWDLRIRMRDGRELTLPAAVVVAPDPASGR